MATPVVACVVVPLARVLDAADPAAAVGDAALAAAVGDPAAGDGAVVARDVVAVGAALLPQAASTAAIADPAASFKIPRRLNAPAIALLLYPCPRTSIVHPLPFPNVPVCGGRDRHRFHAYRFHALVMHLLERDIGRVALGRLILVERDHPPRAIQVPAHRRDRGRDIARSDRGDHLLVPRLDAAAATVIWLAA